MNFDCVPKAWLRALLAAFLTCAMQTAARADTDTGMLEAAQQAQPEVIRSLQHMVSIESGSNDAAGLQSMADYVEIRLRALGAKVDRRKGTTGPAEIITGTFSGSGTRRVMLMGHMDTVYPAGTIKDQPYRIEGGRIYGPGIADDKGGIALVLHALQILKDAGWGDYAQLTVLFNGDEEIGSPGSGQLIAALAAQHDYVLSCEPTPTRPEALLLGASGTGTVWMDVWGRASHAGAAPQIGRNALVELAHQLLQTEDIASSVPGTQLNWTMAKAGLVRNQIPEHATAIGDLRLVDADDFERIEAALRERVRNKRVPGTETSIRVERGRPPFAAGAAARALAARAQAIYAEIDRPLALIEQTGAATDAGFAGSSGKAAVVESFGLAGSSYHARDEYIMIDSIVPRLYLMTRLLQDIGRSR
ncbi:M20/M25/M40 family metallo-hydrolase [Noviherbaspirillum massiliense]|uniref:M20/M25/M40 family metallo-hydrolase n=1 Tax=Noviherbaspirillum massiliense TaxID=1465823 RepID=UPI00036DDC1B|nr:M20/M25/M40 family metallo-hydrolase [Noviherbaspirillum massiliense]